MAIPIGHVMRVRMCIYVYSYADIEQNLEHGIFLTGINNRKRFKYN